MARFNTIPQNIVFDDIAASASGANTVVAAVPGCRIRVHNAQFVATGAVTVTWKSNTTALSGAQAIAANGGIVLPESNLGWFETGVGEALVMDLGGAVVVGGTLAYSLVRD